MREHITDHFKDVDNIAGRPVALDTIAHLTSYDTLQQYDVLVLDVVGAMGGSFMEDERQVIRFLKRVRETYTGILILYTAMPGWDEEYMDDLELVGVQKGSDSEFALVSAIEELVRKGD